MTIADDVLTTLKPQKLSALAGKVRDGDILLCSARDPFSRLIAWSTKSPWSHVALAYRWPALDRVMVFESVQKLGVRAVPLGKFIHQTSDGTSPYPGKIILARHDNYDSKANKAAMKRLADFAVDQFGDPFAPGEIMKIGLRVAMSKFIKKLPKSLGPDDEYICSEYVAKCFHHMGIEIEWDGLGFMAPADIARDPHVQAVARFQTT
jgi:hypothetical protein